MIKEVLYKDYFNIDPKYYAAVTAELIKNGTVKWEGFYPHETFVKLLERTHDMLSGKDNRSLWVEGAYGTGKSYAALTVKCLLEASNEEVESYFEDYGLSKDLCQKIITDKSAGKLITVHRIGSSGIRSDKDLILAVQDSIIESLKSHGIKNLGESSLKEAALKWLKEKEANRIYFNSLINESNNLWEFGGNVDKVIDKLENASDESAALIMRNIMRVADDNGITALRMDAEALSKWIVDIIEKNNLTGILFVWDEFTEYFINNPNTLSGFQTLTEISESSPFYFLIVTHESSSLISDNKTRSKILNRFVGDKTIRIDMPENMAFQLMAQAMKLTDDQVLADQWNDFKDEMVGDLYDARQCIIKNAKKHATMGAKTVVSEKELNGIIPIHPYAALLLKHMSVAFNSNARSMFDFIISNDKTDAKGFKWFIDNYSPTNDERILTIDMLWDFFNGKNQKGLNDDVRSILDSYELIKAGSLSTDEERVFKTILLLEAISMRVSDVDILRPNVENIDLAFSGTDWQKGKARDIAEGLASKGLLFEKPIVNGLKEYTVANKGGNDQVKIKEIKDNVTKELRTKNLIFEADLSKSVILPIAYQQRFNIEYCSYDDLNQTINKFESSNKPNRFKTVFCFAKDDNEAVRVRENIEKCKANGKTNFIYVECLTTMGNDLLTQYVDNLSYGKYYEKTDHQRAKGYEKNCNKVLDTWKKNINKGGFIIHFAQNNKVIRVTNLETLQEEFKLFDRETYPCGLEHLTLNDTLFQKSNSAQGAECGIKQVLKGQFYSSNSKTSLVTALDGAWEVEEYWKNSAISSFYIVRIKNKVDEFINDSFENNGGRVNVLELFEILEQPPFGFMPSNVAAFMMGFVLKEYANSNYFWSNDSTTEVMDVAHMKQMIADVINQKATPNAKYKHQYIVTMSSRMRCFLDCTARVFKIDKSKCSSLESAREQIRVKMKGLVFPIWCVKNILDELSIKSSREEIENIIDAYSGIANNANSESRSESELAEAIGTLVENKPEIIDDLQTIIVGDNCHLGMIAYIEKYQGGKLITLASQICDGGAYIDCVKQKFNADAANWVWSKETANDRISDVILEYEIIVESNKYLPKSTSLKETVDCWSTRVDNIVMPCSEICKYLGGIKPLLEMLSRINKNCSLAEQDKKGFLECLVSCGAAFYDFYNDQLSCFRKVVSSSVIGLDDDGVEKLYNSLSGEQYNKSTSEYFKYIDMEYNNVKKSMLKTQLVDLWKEKTDTKSPMEWSEKFETPILCLFDNMEREEAKKVFSYINNNAGTDEQLRKSIDFLKKGTFYERLTDKEIIDNCFKNSIIGNYDILLKDISDVRRILKSNCSIPVYEWLDNSVIRRYVENLADKKYKISGVDMVNKVIGDMDADELRKYVLEMVDQNMKFGMEILRNKEQ